VKKVLQATGLKEGSEMCRCEEDEDVFFALSELCPTTAL